MIGLSPLAAVEKKAVARRTAGAGTYIPAPLAPKAVVAKAVVSKAAPKQKLAGTYITATKAPQGKVAGAYTPALKALGKAVGGQGAARTGCRV